MINELLRRAKKLDSYIEKRLLEIEDLEKRIKVREELENNFEEVYLYINKKYASLAKRLSNEAVDSKSDFDIHIKIIPRKDYDVTNGVFYPMDAVDLQNEVATSFYVYADMTLEEISEITDEKCKFTCTLVTQDGRQQTSAKLVINEKYKSIINQLRLCMINNGKACKSINSQDVDKVLEIQFECGCDHADIVEAIVDFGHYSEKIKKDVIPVWNVEEMESSCAIDKRACVSYVIYEHEPVVKYEDINKYIVMNDMDTFSVINISNRMLVTSLKRLENLMTLCYVHDISFENNHEGEAIENENEHIYSLDMNCDKTRIWEFLLEDLNEDIFFEQSDNYSPYNESIKVEQGDNGQICYFNALNRYEEVFIEYFEKYGIPETYDEKVLLDIKTHLLATTDLMEGISYKEYQKNIIEKDIIAGVYGTEVSKMYGKLSKEQRYVIVHYLELQESLYNDSDYEMMFEIFSKVLNCLLQRGTLYQDKYKKNKSYFYMGIEKNEKDKEIIELVKMLFLPCNYELEIFWGDHFALVEETSTLYLGNINLL